MHITPIENRKIYDIVTVGLGIEIISRLDAYHCIEWWVNRIPNNAFLVSIYRITAGQNLMTMNSIAIHRSKSFSKILGSNYQLSFTNDEAIIIHSDNIKTISKLRPKALWVWSI